jgi:2-polyprenyl-6-methoxyphenol hydroxylase-like FAD-dependent oxidoreductase
MDDVLVVGAGPTGLTLACELRRHGVGCRLIEELATPHPWSKAAAVHARTMELLDDMGLAEELLGRAKAIQGANIHAGGQRIGHVAVDGIESRYPHIYGVSQRETEDVLGAQLERLGGRVERGVKLESFVEDDGVVSAVVVGADGARTTVAARYLVGCDGAHSTVRRSLGIEFGGASYEERILQADVHIDWPGRDCDDEIMMFIGSDGPLALFPLFKDGRYRLVAVLMPGAPEVDATLDVFQRLAAERGPAGIQVTDPAWMVPFRIHCRHVEKYRVGNVFIAGDACHIHSPAGGQGMNTGMQDAYNLGWKLALVARGRARPELLDSYEAERLPIARQLLSMTDSMTRGMERAVKLKNPIALALRDRLVRFVTSLGVFQERMARTLSQTMIGYPGSPIVAQDRPSVLSAHVTRDGEEPTLLGWSAFGDGPTPGERAPYAPCGTAHTLELVRGAKHVLFLFDGAAATEAGYRNLDAIAAQVRARWGDIVTPHIVVPHAARPAALTFDSVLLDPDGSFHRRFGARSECLYLVRPDGYVGYRCQPADGERLERYLAAHFVAPAAAQVA